MHSKWAATLVLLLVFFAGHASAQTLEIPDGARCEACGMMLVRDSKFSSQAVVDPGGRKVFFCDIGDMLDYMSSKKSVVKSAWVRDYTIGEWIDASRAFYVLNKKFITPMSWGIAAFRSQSEAKPWGAPVDYQGALKLIR